MIRFHHGLVKVTYVFDDWFQCVNVVSLFCDKHIHSKTSPMMLNWLYWTCCGVCDFIGNTQIQFLNCIFFAKTLPLAREIRNNLITDKDKIPHYCDVTMDRIASQITSLAIVYSIVYSDADQRKHQSSASLAFVRGIHRGPVNSPLKWPVTRKMFPFDDVIMKQFKTTVTQHACLSIYTSTSTHERLLRSGGNSSWKAATTTMISLQNNGDWILAKKLWLITSLIFSTYEHTQAGTETLATWKQSLFMTSVTVLLFHHIPEGNNVRDSSSGTIVTANFNVIFLRSCFGHYWSWSRFPWSDYINQSSGIFGEVTVHLGLGITTKSWIMFPAMEDMEFSYGNGRYGLMVVGTHGRRDSWS